MKKVALLTAFILFASSLFCDDKINISFWHAMADPKDKVLNSLISDFEKENPDIKVTPQYVGTYDTLLQKLQASLAAGNPPDISQVYENWTTKFMEDEAIIPVEKFMKKDGNYTAEMEDIYPIFVKNNSYGKEMWTFPFNKSIYVYYYNADLFKKAGVNPPENIKEFLDVCTKLTKKDASGKIVQYGFGFRANVDIFAILLYLNKGRFLNDNETKCVFNDETGIETLQFIVDLVNKYNVAYYTKEYVDNDFTSQRMASFFATSPHRSYIQPLLKFQLGEAPLPAWKVQVAPIAGTNIAIFAKKNDSEKREEACWRFIKSISSAQGTVKWAMGTSYLPIRKSALNNNLFQDHLKKQPLDLIGIKQLDNAITDPRIKVWQEARTYLDEAVEKALLKKASVSDALNEAAKKMDNLLKK